MEIEYIVGDITQLDVEAVVNAANSSLLGGGGVDGAIHRKAGEELYFECMKLNGCETGDAKITKGYNLKAKHIIHTVGPVWTTGVAGEELLLKECYLNSLKLAEENNIKTIAFPCISTGAYDFPPVKAAKVALEVIRNFEYRNIEKVIICCYLERDYNIYQSLLNPTVENKILTGFEKIKILFRQKN